MLSWALADDVPTEYGDLFSEELGFISRDVEMPADAIPDESSLSSSVRASSRRT
jgi:4-hydroxyacetophenone monooxygenase